MIECQRLTELTLFTSFRYEKNSLYYYTLYVTYTIFYSSSKVISRSVASICFLYVGCHDGLRQVI